jgi:hypothetical protein
MRARIHAETHRSGTLADPQEAYIAAVRRHATERGIPFHEAEQHVQQAEPGLFQQFVAARYGTSAAVERRFGPDQLERANPEFAVVEAVRAVMAREGVDWDEAEEAVKARYPKTWSRMVQERNQR